jgi:hypothetical protein
MTPTPPADTPRPPAHPERPGHPFRGAIAVALLLLTGVTAAWVVSERVDPVYKPHRVRYRDVVGTGSQVQALSLGNSHSQALDFETLGLRGRDLWNPGYDFLENEHLLRSIRPHLPNLEYVFLPISLFVYDNATSTMRVELRKQAYVQTGNYRPVAGDYGAAFKALISPVVRWDNWEGVAYRMVGRRSPNTGEGDLDEGRAGHLDQQRPSAEVLREHAVKRAQLHRSTEQASLAENPDLCADARAALREIARLAPPAHLVLYTPPFSPAYLSHRDPRTGCNLSAFAAELDAASPLVTYYDDHATAAFTDESGLFRDGDHINVYGSRVYSRMLAERLGLPGAEGSPPTDAEAPPPEAQRQRPQGERGRRRPR